MTANCVTINMVQKARPPYNAFIDRIKVIYMFYNITSIQYYKNNQKSLKLLIINNKLKSDFLQSFLYYTNTLFINNMYPITNFWVPTFKQNKMFGGSNDGR